ncbi:hypothetical protein [Fusicatenibacter saccharivorans]|uniref:hypothetical protein n=1 Tax=Fusicatenibacter saccharivorans TaxID=1150298 RepID=UPI003D02D61E
MTKRVSFLDFYREIPYAERDEERSAEHGFRAAHRTGRKDIPFFLQGCDGFRPLQRMSADALAETLIREGESEVEVVTR